MSKRLGYTIENAGSSFTTSTISNLLATNVTSATLLASNGITTGNINFTGNLYQNGQTYTSSQWLTGTGGNLSYTNGNVGIATTAPQFNLHVAGSSYISGGITTGNINFTGNLFQNGAPYLGSQWLSGTGGNLSYTNGNVGINTTSPSVTLDVNGTARFTTGITAASAQLTNANATNITSATLNLSSGLTSASAQITNLNATTVTAATLKNTDTITTNVSGGTLNLSTGLTSASAQITNAVTTNVSCASLNLSTSLMAVGNSNTIGNVFTTGGNVGIGTTSPGESLDVRGNLRVGGSTKGNYISFYGTFGDSPGGWNHTFIGERIYAGTEQSELLLFKGNDQSTGSGPDRIRLLAAEHRFDTYTSNVSGAFEDVGATSASNRMTITTAGNVGIGTSTPGFLLDVNGTARIATGITTGGLEVTGLTDTLNLTATNITTTNLSVNTFNPANINTTNITSATLNLSSGITTASAQITNANITTSTIATLLSTNAISTNITSATLNLSTGITAASAQITNANVTTSTIATLLNTNAVSTNITSATLNLSTGITAASAQITNARFTTGITSASLRIDGKADIYGDILIGDTSGNYAGNLKTSYESSGANQVVIESLRGDGGILFRTNAGGTIGNRMRITNNGSVGIGTTSPSANLHVNGSAIISTGLTTASAQITNSLVAIGTSNTVGSIFTTGGNVGMGTTAPSYALQVAGDVYASGDVISFSDARLKTDIETIENALDKIKSLRGVYYKHIQTQKRGVGLIAQEAQQVIPEAVIEKEQEYLGVAYGNIVGMLVEAVKELSQKIEYLEKQFSE
jgi:trimeric autotransporter adhesin